MNLAIQLLQCKPDNFVSQKLDNVSINKQLSLVDFIYIYNFFNYYIFTASYRHTGSSFTICYV